MNGPAKARLVTVATTGDFVAFRGPMRLGERRVWMAWCSDDECGYTKGETHFRDEAIRWADEHNTDSHSEAALGRDGRGDSRRGAGDPPARASVGP